MSMTVNTGWRTQISASFMARLCSARRTLPRYRLGRPRCLLNEISVVQLPGGGCRHAVPRLESFCDLESPAVLFVLGLPRRPHLALLDAAPIDQKNFVHAIAVVHSRLRNGDRFFLFFARDGCLHKKSGFEARVMILDDRLGFKGARVLRYCGIDAGDPALEQVGG